jgi:hypothetical protein
VAVAAPIPDGGRTACRERLGGPARRSHPEPANDRRPGRVNGPTRASVPVKEAVRHRSLGPLVRNRRRRPGARDRALDPAVRRTFDPRAGPDQDLDLRPVRNQEPVPGAARLRVPVPEGDLRPDRAHNRTAAPDLVSDRAPAGPNGRGRGPALAPEADAAVDVGR